jgi:serine/threonine protein kinase
MCSGLAGSPEALDLVSSMVQRDPAKRPTSSMVLQHPFFWCVALLHAMHAYIRAYRVMLLSDVT